MDIVDLYALARRASKNERGSDQEELIQLTVLKVLRAVNGGNWKTTTLSRDVSYAYVAQTLQSIRVDLSREDQKTRGALAVLAGVLPPETGGAPEWARILWASHPNSEVVVAARSALARLSPKQRRILFLQIVERRPTREVADLLGTTSDAVRQSRFRALRKLQTDLSQLLDEG